MSTVGRSDQMSVPHNSQCCPWFSHSLHDHMVKPILINALLLLPQLTNLSLIAVFLLNSCHCMYFSFRTFSDKLQSHDTTLNFSHLQMHIVSDMHYAPCRLKLNVFLSVDMRSVLVLEGLAIVLVLILVREGPCPGPWGFSPC
jgi:hypothetical protein